MVSGAPRSDRPRTDRGPSISQPADPVPENNPYKVEYRNEAEATKPNTACPGSLNVPFAAVTVAKEGQLCVFRGNQFGSKETEDKNAEFTGFQDALGNELGGTAQVQRVKPKERANPGKPA